MLTGRVAKLSLIGGPAKLVRETRLFDGSPYGRVTHVAFAVPNLGCAELVVTEYLLKSDNGGQQPTSFGAFVRRPVGMIRTDSAPPTLSHAHDGAVSLRANVAD